MSFTPEIDKLIAAFKKPVCWQYKVGKFIFESEILDTLLIVPYIDFAGVDFNEACTINVVVEQHQKPRHIIHSDIMSIVLYLKSKVYASQGDPALESTITMQIPLYGHNVNQLQALGIDIQELVVEVAGLPYAQITIADDGMIVAASIKFESYE